MHKLIKKRLFLNTGLVLFLFSLLLVIPAPAAAQGEVTVSISPVVTRVDEGDDFWILVSVGQVNQLHSYQFDIFYDSSVIMIEGNEGGAGVEGGLITDASTNPQTVTDFPINWKYTVAGTPGRITVNGILPPFLGASGNGYLARIHFRTSGTYGDRSVITPLKLTMTNRIGADIQVNPPIQGRVEIPYLPINVSIDAPANLVPGGEFIARINISKVVHLQAYQFEINYNPQVIKIIGNEGGETGVTPGQFDSVTIAPVLWIFSPPGSPGAVRVITSISETNGITGEGYLVDLHFQVTGAVGQSTPLRFSTSFNNRLFDPLGLEMQDTTWISTQCTVNSQCSIISNSPLPSAEVGFNYNTGLEIWGGIPPHQWSVAGGALPDGLSLDALTGVISGIPTESAQTSSVMFRVMDGNGNISTKSLTVKILPATRITSTSLIDGSIGVPYIVRLNAEGGLSPYVWSISAGTLPSGLNFNPPTGVISGIPTEEATPQIVTFIVTDALGASDSIELLINILDEAVILTNSPLPTGEVGLAYYCRLLFSGGSPPVTWTILNGQLPSGLNLNASTGVISGIPAVNKTAIILFKATDSAGGIVSKELAITIAARPAIITASLPNGEVGAPYMGNLNISGGLYPLTWTIVAGSLPDGLNLDQESGVISGTPSSATAALPVTFSVYDSLGGSATKSFKITILPPPLITTASLPDSEIGANYSTGLAARGGSAPYYWSIEFGSLPPGLTLQASNGTISGKTTQSGAYMIQFKVADSSGGCSTRMLSINVNLNPTIEDSILPQGQTGQRYTHTFMASGGTTPYKWSIVSGSLPRGLTLGSTTGTISGIPTTAANSQPVTIKITSRLGGYSTASFQVTIIGKPEIVTNSLEKTETGLPYSQTLIGVGGKPPYVWSVYSGRLPTGFFLNPNTGTISGTTSTATKGSAITFRLTDSLGGTANKRLTIQVLAGPAINTTKLKDGAEGLDYNNKLSAKNGVAPYTWSLASGDLPLGLELNPKTGVISGVPQLAAGPTTLVIQVVDSLNGSALKQFTFSIFGAPEISTEFLELGEVRCRYSQLLAVSEGLSPFQWSIVSGKLPSGLTLNRRTGVISGTPRAVFGPVTITFKVTDSQGATATKNLSLTIIAAPRITSASTLKNGQTYVPYNHMFTAADGAPPYLWSISSGALPKGLTLDTNTGIISGTPTATTRGSRFVVRVTDALGGYVTKNYSIEIVAAPKITTTTVTNGRALASYKAILRSSGGVQPFTWSIIDGALPEGLNLDDKTGVISGKPVQKSGIVTITVQLTDSYGVTDTRTFTFSIN